jgi:hypothetical protein
MAILFFIGGGYHKHGVYQPGNIFEAKNSFDHSYIGSTGKRLTKNPHS